MSSVNHSAAVGISQRDISMKYQHIVEGVHEFTLKILSFFENVVKGRFSLATFVFDCYVPEAAGASTKLIDFSPFGCCTDPLLFEWEELETMRGSNMEADFRFIDSDIPLKPESALYGVPFDFVDTSNGSALNSLLEHAQSGSMPWDTFCAEQERDGG